MSKELRLNKEDVVVRYAAKYDLTKKAAKAEISRYNDFHRELLSNTDGIDSLEVSYPGFVKFTATRVPAHDMVVNFSGETVTVPEKVIVKAKASKAL